jgi:hypothetical protein
MPDDSSIEETAPNTEPRINGPANNRLVIAFPFSGIKINEADETVLALASLVAELAELVATNAPSSETEGLASRARALSERLAH